MAQSFVKLQPSLGETLAGREPAFACCLDSVSVIRILQIFRVTNHTFDEMSNAPEPTFIIEGFLPKDVITAIAAPESDRLGRLHIVVKPGEPVTLSSKPGPKADADGQEATAL